MFVAVNEATSVWIRDSSSFGTTRLRRFAGFVVWWVLPDARSRCLRPAARGLGFFVGEEDASDEVLTVGSATQGAGQDG